MGSSVASVASAIVSVVGEHQKHKAAKTQRRNQQRALEKEKQAALEERKGQIDMQRENLSATGTGTRGFSSSGIKANIDKLG